MLLSRRKNSTEYSGLKQDENPGENFENISGRTINFSLLRTPRRPQSLIRGSRLFGIMPQQNQPWEFWVSCVF